MTPEHGLLTWEKRRVPPGGEECVQAELEHSIQEGSPGGDSQLHGLLLGGGDRAAEIGLECPKVPSHNTGDPPRERDSGGACKAAQEGAV